MYAKIIRVKCSHSSKPLPECEIFRKDARLLGAYLKCDKQCDSCKSKYSIENCEELRQKIFDYYLMFTKINQRTDEIVKGLE